MTTKTYRFQRMINIFLVIAILLITEKFTFITIVKSSEPEPQNRVIYGEGKFPRLPIVMPGEDGKTLAVYLVENNTATELTLLADLVD